jgi:hypothetical protein
LRDLIQPQQERPDMATPEITAIDSPEPTPALAGAAPPVIGPALKRILIAGAIYIVVMSWLALMQVFAGWDPEILVPVGIVGASLIATLAFAKLGGNKPETAPMDGADGSGAAD